MTRVLLSLLLAPAVALAQMGSPAGLAFFDDNIATLQLPEVLVGDDRYAVSLTLDTDGHLRLSAATPIDAPVAAAPAQFAGGVLSVPKVRVGEQYFSASFRLGDGLGFTLTEAAPTSPVSFLTAWEQTGFRASAPSIPRHVNRVITGDGGRVHAAWYSQENRAYVSYTDDGGSTWQHTALDRMLQLHQLIRLSDGTLVTGGQAFANAPLLWASADGGRTWRSGGNGLPNPRSTLVWDLVERNGEVIITTSSEANDPGASHEVVYAWNPVTDQLRALAPLPGMGALAVAVDGDGVLYVSTQDSAEHDDPATAGEGRVYRSTDGGGTWAQTGRLPSANRIYALTVLSDGSVAAGSGLNGGFYLTRNGQDWVAGNPLPAGQKLSGDPPMPTSASVTRVYKILELKSGSLLVGTGNEAGDLLLTCDRGSSWTTTSETGGNIVAWGLAQEENGTLWTSNGSVQGDIWKAPVPAGIESWQHYSCY